MYVSTKGQLIRGLFQLGGLVARGAVAAAAHRRAQRSEADELTMMAGGEPGCGECEEEKQRIQDEADAWSRGLGDGR